MNRIAFATLIFIMMLLPTYSAHADIGTRLSSEGIAPFPFTAEEIEILSAFGIDSNAHALAFNAPAGTHAIHIYVYKNEKQAEWLLYESGSIVDFSDEPLDGLFTMIVNQDSSIELRLSSISGMSFTSAPIENYGMVKASSEEFLQDYHTIELEKEIPVAMMVYDRNYDDGAPVGEYSLDDYYNPERFDVVDTVRVVTLMFSALTDENGGASVSTEEQASQQH